MDVTRVSDLEFAAALHTGEAHDQFGDPGGHALLVDGDQLGDVLDRSSMQRLSTLACVVAAVTDDPERCPEWADLVLGTHDPQTDAFLETVRANPQAATVLAVLLRSGETRSTSEGLLAESAAYGLLQGGPEFARWRRTRTREHRQGEDGPTVLVEREGDRLLVTLNRPRVLNALNAAMRDELDAALHLAVIDPSITAVHLRGAGQTFCSGGDLDEFGTRSDPPTAHLIRLIRSPTRTIAEIADRTTAHLSGRAIGSGIEMAAFAHRVLATGSTRISLPEVRLGLIPGAGGTVSLPRRIGRHATMLLALATESIDAATALEWGLVDEVSG